MTVNETPISDKTSEFETLMLMIKSEHPCEFLAVNQLDNDLILINEHNIDSSSQSGEILEYSSDLSEYIHNKLHESIEAKEIVLR